MTDKDRIALILDILKDPKKIEKNAQDLLAQINKFESARSDSVVAKSEADKSIKKLSDIQSDIDAAQKNIKDQNEDLQKKIELLNKDREKLKDEQLQHLKNVDDLSTRTDLHKKSVSDLAEVRAKFEDEKKSFDNYKSSMLTDIENLKKSAQDSVLKSKAHEAEAEKIKKDLQTRLDNVAAAARG